MLALVVAAAVTVLTASRRELLAEFALPQSQTHGLLTLTDLQHTAELLLPQSHVRGCYIHDKESQHLQYAEALLVKINKLRISCHHHKQSGSGAALLRA